MSGPHTRRKLAKASASWHFALQGFVAVLPNDRWPSGPHGVAAVVHRLAGHAAQFGGEVGGTVLMGESGGAVLQAIELIDQ